MIFSQRRLEIPCFFNGRFRDFFHRTSWCIFQQAMRLFNPEGDMIEQLEIQRQWEIWTGDLMVG